MIGVQKRHRNRKRDSGNPETGNRQWESGNRAIRESGKLRNSGKTGIGENPGNGNEHPGIWERGNTGIWNRGIIQDARMRETGHGKWERAISNQNNLGNNPGIQTYKRAYPKWESENPRIIWETGNPGNGKRGETNTVRTPVFKP